MFIVVHSDWIIISTKHTKEGKCNEVTSHILVSTQVIGPVLYLTPHWKELRFFLSMFSYFYWSKYVYALELRSFESMNCEVSGHDMPLQWGQITFFSGRGTKLQFQNRRGDSSVAGSPSPTQPSLHSFLHRSLPELGQDPLPAQKDARRLSTTPEHWSKGFCVLKDCSNTTTEKRWYEKILLSKSHLSLINIF